MNFKKLEYSISYKLFNAFENLENEIHKEHGNILEEQNENNILNSTCTIDKIYNYYSNIIQTRYKKVISEIYEYPIISLIKYGKI